MGHLLTLEFWFLARWPNEHTQSVLSAYGGAGQASWTRTETPQEELDLLQKEISHQNNEHEQFFLKKNN